ncbi:unnamed protein product [Arctia plantaginis]|uniref:Uncharacterized protein n=1 Tax=Arctia plantaginis TaxID=874455 RepID=A0A8S1A0A4_ARCPL|nr:unnamed protein product [Arctia plantaginis]
MFICISCNLQHTDGPTCSVCKNQYDFGCAGVTENGFRRLGERKNNWRCSKCKLSPLPSPASASPVPSQLDKMQEQLNQIVFQLAPLASLIEDIKSIKSDVNNLKESVEMAHGLISTFSSSIKSLDERIMQVEKVATEIPSMQAEISRLNRELDDKDQWARANNVEIRGIPQKKNENLKEADRITN